MFWLCKAALAHLPPGATIIHHVELVTVLPE